MASASGILERLAGKRRSLRAAMPLVLMLAAGLPAAAQGVSGLETRRQQTAVELQELARNAEMSRERLQDLEAEIELIEKDRRSITASLIQSAKTEKKLAQDIEDAADRLAVQREREEDIRKSLDERRDVLAEVLAALQRMGRNPPPALLVRPGDAVASVRSAIMLGAVVPEIRSETELLAADLAELSKVVSTINAERQRLSATFREQAVEKERLSRLLEEKSALRDNIAAATDEERRKAAELAGKAGSLQELIAGLDAEIEAVRREAEKQEQARLEQEARLRDRLARAGDIDPEQQRLAASLPFSALAGKLSLPAAGRFVQRFGDTDDTGHVANGDTITTQSGAIVTAVADGRILYAGPFRTYGQLLILDAGEDYHVVMAGMGRLSVAQGQSVLAGEPVGFMGESRIASAALAPGTADAPTLYVEFRKDRKPVDPSSWWAGPETGRTTGF